MQNDRPPAFYSRKLNSAQKWYTIGKQELLSIVETLKEFKNTIGSKADSAYGSQESPISENVHGWHYAMETLH